MKLVVVRHGETEYNAQNRYAGSTDVPLSGEGKEQAERLAKSLEGIAFDCVVSSPLLRARQTTEIVNRGRGLPVKIIEGFAERNMGVYEGLTREEARSKYPDTWKRLGNLGVDDAPEGGETIRQCDRRVTDALEKLIRENEDKTVLLVCHGFVSRLINRYFNQLDYQAMHSFTLGNCEIAQYEAPLL